MGTNSTYRADVFPKNYKGIKVEVPDELPRSILKMFAFFAKPFWLAIVLQLVAGVMLRVLTTLQIYVAKNVADVAMVTDLKRPDAFTLLFHPFSVILIIFAIQIVTEWVAWFCSYQGRIRVLARARQVIFSYVQRHNATYFDDMLTGKVAYRAMLMPEQVVGLYERVCWEYLPFVFQSAIILFMFAQISPLIAVLVGIWWAAYMGLSVLLGRRISRFGAIHSDVKAQLTGRIVDSITNIRNIIYFAAEDTEDRIVTSAVRNTFEAQRRQYREFVRMRVMMQQTMQVVVYVGIFPLVIKAMLAGQMTPAAFVMVSSLIITMTRNLADLGNGMPETYDMIGSVRDSIETLVVKRKMQDAPGASALVVKNAEIRFDHVGFTYGSDQKVFEGLNLVIPAGQKVGLIGSSGAGKTTLSALLMRLYDVTEGAITIDGHNLGAVTQTSLRANIGLIPQDTILFHRSLMDNIRYGRPGASDDEVMEAARRAFAHDFIMALPKGYLTMVGERGIKLSGGQRQRIAVARAILKNAPILILDEATSALDSESEAAVQSAMADVMQGKTVIAIAHRLSTIAHLDRLIVLDKGKIVEDGSHRELLAKGGIYAQLWNRQSGGFLTES